MKKIFTLIAVAVMAMGVNAQTTIFSWEAGTATGGTVVGNGADAENVKEEFITLSSKKTNIADDNITITLNQALAENDEIAITGYIKKDASKQSSAYLLFADGVDAETEPFGDEANIDAAFNGTATTKPAIKVPAGAAGIKIIKIARGKTQTNLYITKIEITRGGAGGPEVWDAASLPYDEKTKTILDVVKTENTSGSYIIPAEIKQFPEGTFPDKAIDVATWLDQQDDPSIYAITLNDYVFTASTANVSLKAVSTPNATENDKPDVECWQSAGGEESNMALNTADCPIKWTNYVKAKNGNPSLGYYNYYDTNSDGDAVNRVSDVLWSIGCGKAPGKGSYFEFTFKKAGAMVMGVYLNRPNQSSVVVIDKETLAPLAYTDLSFQGFCQNNTVKYPNNGEDSTDPTFQTFQFRDDYTINVEANASRPLIGYLSFPVEAKTYMVFQPSSQLGIYGFQFTEGGSTNGVETITANKVWNADAPMYNLAGQKVDKSYKGIVIQNGRKFYNK